MGQEFSNGHAGYINVESKIPRMSCDEILLDNEHSESRGKPLIRPDQNNIALVEDLVYEFSSGGNLVPDPFESTLSTGSSCVLVENFSNFV